MKQRRKRCPYCNDLFYSEPELKHQITCGKRACQKKRRIASTKRWRKENRSFQGSHGIDESYQGTHAKWKQKYRRTHPEYVQKNRIYWWKWKFKQSPSNRGNEDSLVITKGYTT